MSEPEIMEMLRRVQARFRGIQHVGSPEVIGARDLVLLEHEALPHNVVVAIRIQDLCEANLLFAITSTRARWRERAAS